MTLILAPIRGVTDHIFRTAFGRHFGGFDFAVAPFITAVKGDGIALSHFRDILPQHNRVMPVVPQAIGNRAEELLGFARAATDLGYKEVNWNLGCPFEKVTRKKRGSGLLPHPEIVGAICSEVFAKSPISWSVKVRLGLNNASDLLALLPVLDAYPFTDITIHARTAIQQYSGAADAEAFAACMAATRHRLCYNGDIVTRNGFIDLTRRFPTLSRWMIGRGALIDPWLPQMLHGPLLQPKRNMETLNAFHSELFERYKEILCGPMQLLGKMKGLWGYLGNAFEDGEKIQKKIFKTTSIGRYVETVDLLFNNPPVWSSSLTQ